MPAGFYAQNPDSGTYVIDDTFRSLAVRATGTVTLDADGYGSVTRAGPVSPMLAIRCTTNTAVFGGTVFTGGSMNWNLRGTPGAVVTYYVFDVPTAQPGNYGLQIYNAAGQLCFDSSMQYARFAGRLLDDNVTVTPASLTLPTGKTYAVVMLKSAWEFHRNYKTEGIPSPEGNTYFRTRFDRGGVSVNSNVIQMGWYDLGNYDDWSDHPFPAEQLYLHPTYGHYSADALILDVTGY